MRIQETVEVSKIAYYIVQNRTYFILQCTAVDANSWRISPKPYTRCTMYKFNERKETPRQQDFLLPQDEQGEYSNALKNVTVRGKSVNGQFEQCVYNKGNR